MLSKRIFVLVFVVAFATLIVGCVPTVPEIGNLPPEITSTPVETAQIGVEYTYYVDATDQDGDALTYSLIRNPSGMEIDEHTGVITWEYPTVGSHGVTVKVSDGVLYATQPFIVTVIPVAEFTKIEVTPDTMDLVVGDIVTFEVFAHYSFGDPQDITDGCVYTQPTTGVVTVIAGSVTAVEAGTDTILISYTIEGDITVTANIAVTVSGVKIPMEIIVVIPTFKAGIPYWFTVDMIANSDLGKFVRASFDWPISALGVKISGTLETDVGSDVTFALTGDVFQSEFTMEDTIVNFRGTFTSPGIYGTTIEVRTYPGDVLLCSKDIEIVVEAVRVGDFCGGGIVAYILQSGDSGYDADIQHGLIAATENQTPTDSGILWATEDYQETTVPGGTLVTIGSGSANTDNIIAQHGGVSTDYAAGLARAYNGGGYTDWFLPSKDELEKLYDNRVVIGGFSEASGDSGVYWSSSESDASRAWYQNFVDFVPEPNYWKDWTCKVRTVRAF